MKVEYAALMEGQPLLDLLRGKLAREDELDPIQYVIEAVGQVIDDDNFGLCLLDDADDCVGAHKAQASRHK